MNQNSNNSSNNNASNNNSNNSHNPITPNNLNNPIRSNKPSIINNFSKFHHNNVPKKGDSSSKYLNNDAMANQHLDRNGVGQQLNNNGLQNKSMGNISNGKNVIGSKTGADIGSKAGTAAGAFLGGKVGAKIGSKIGSSIGSKVGSKVGSKDSTTNGKINNTLSNKMNNKAFNKLKQYKKPQIPLLPNINSKNAQQQTDEDDEESQENASNKISDGIKSGLNGLLKDKSKKMLKGLLIKAIPVIAISIVIIIALIVIMAILLAVFGGIGGISSTDAGLDKMDASIQYCNTVNLSYNGTTTTISDDEYIAYEIANSKVKNITNRSVIMAISIIYRTNLYADTANINNKVCNVTLNKEYKAPENEDYLNYTKETTNKVFAFQKNKLTTLPYNEYFSWKEIYSDSTGTQYYRSFIDGDGRFQYEKKWIDKNVPVDMMNQDSSQTYGFSFYGATFIAENNPMEIYDFLLYYYYVSITKDPSKQYGQIYLIDKSGDSSTGEGIYTGVCSNFDIHTTTLSEADFTKKVQEAAAKNSNLNIFYQEASQIYKLAKANNVNPELVVVRAEVEGFSPGIVKNNYWGMGCTNTGGLKACINYSSFDDGVLGFINFVKKYGTAQELMGVYANIGTYWYNNGNGSSSMGAGGCYYFPYIKKYMSEDRVNEITNYCVSGKNCSTQGVGDCLKSTAEDQLAYTTWQVVDKMIPVREKIFGIGAEDCTENPQGEAAVTGAGSGAEVARYAVSTFDNYLYSQSQRNQPGYVDCSSMVARAYKHFGLIIYYGSKDESGATGDEYIWCKNNGKLIAGSELRAGDLIFYNTGSHYDRNQAANIGHVTMYIGNNQQFSARSSKYAAKDQVAITPYYGDGNFFCRPYK
jgi:hypothetical protein